MCILLAGLLQYLTFYYSLLNLYRTHSDGTTVSSQYFTGFRNKDVYESFVRCKAIEYWESKVFKCDSGIENYFGKEKTLILEMIEDLNAPKFKNKYFLEIYETRASFVLPHESNDLSDNYEDFPQIPVKSVKYTKHYICEEINISKCKALTLSKVNIASQLPVSPVRNSKSQEMANQSNSSRIKRGPSPLLFTPVKGENTYGAGYLTQTPDNKHNSPFLSKNQSTSKNFLSPTLSTPPPNPLENIVSSSSPLGYFYTDKLRNRKKTAENDLKPNTSCLPSKYVRKKIQSSESCPHRIKPSPPVEQRTDTPKTVLNNDKTIQTCSSCSYKSEPPHLDERTTSSSKTVTNTELSSSLFISSNVENMHGVFSSSPDSLPVPKCGLIQDLKSSPSKGIIAGNKPLLKTKVISPCNPAINTASKKEDKPNNSVEDCGRNLSKVLPNLRTRRKHRLRTLVLRARNSLSGLPPPPTVTVPQMSVQEMLEKIRESELNISNSSYGAEISQNPARLADGSDTSSLFQPSATDKDVMGMAWPAVLDCIHLGICYNLGCSSETLEDLCQQVCAKYVGNETASSCTIWSMPKSSEESSTKRRNGALNVSSIAKDSYITRRRRAFSLASLNATVPSISSKCRQILVNGVLKKANETKKMQTKNRRECESGRIAKRDSKLSAERCFGNKGKNLSKLNSIKRSLSFDIGSDNPAQSSSSSLSESSSSTYQNSSCLLTSTKRVLKFDIMSKPSTQTQSKISSSSSSFSLPGRDDDASMHNTPRSQSLCMKNVAVKELSELHKKKLLWAVAEALRSRGINTGHNKFKICAIPLFRHCRDRFLNTLSDKQKTSVKSGCSDNFCDSSSVDSSDCHKESTSDKMLHIAKGIVDQVMNEVGVAPMLKERAI